MVMDLGSTRKLLETSPSWPALLLTRVKAPPWGRARAVGSSSGPFCSPVLCWGQKLYLKSPIPIPFVFKPGLVLLISSCSGPFLSRSHSPCSFPEHLDPTTQQQDLCSTFLIPPLPPASCPVHRGNKHKEGEVRQRTGRTGHHEGVGRQNRFFFSFPRLSSWPAWLPNAAEIQESH